MDLCKESRRDEDDKRIIIIIIIIWSNVTRIKAIDI